MTGAVALPAILNEPTLVLNRSWMAIAIAPVRDALSMVFRGHARVIHPETFQAMDFTGWASLTVPDDMPAVTTPRLRIRVPEVISLTLYNGVPVQRVPFTRRNLFRRDRYMCQYCGTKPGSENLTIDHIVPRVLGGVSSWDNCVLACVPCNTRKGCRPLERTGMKLKRRPKEPPWTTLFEIPVGQRKASWEQFVSDRYWNIPLEE